ncbi:lipopolysaccharide biosynthesis protein [Nitrosophilus labii]|uniref:lipopolysaccharide biosynthesis protein n=1 Tax=Nitrosophilus labii TaxID=2706014 RepID=UPI0016572C4D|nr:oligosaccharide flippase family protein [Nitrosophilus labii]
MKKILKLAFSYSAIEGFQKGLFFFITPLLTYYITPEEYGNISIIFIFIAFFQIIFAFSLESTIMRYYVRLKNEKLKKDFLGTVILISIFSIVFWITVLSIVGPFFFKIIFSNLSFYPYIFIAILIVSFKMINILYISFLKVVQNIKEFAIFYNFYFLSQTSFVLYFVIFFNFKKDLLYLNGMLYSNILFAVIALYKLNKKINLTINKKIIKLIFNYSISIIPLRVVNIINSSIDRFLLLNIIGGGVVGVYYLGLQIGSIAQIIMLAINSAYVPIFFKLYEKNKNRLEFKEIYSIINKLVFIAGIVEVLLLFFYPLLFNIINSSYIEAKNIVPIFILYYIFGIVYFINTNALSISALLNRKKVFGIIYGIVVNIIFSLLLIKYLGAIGVAIGSLLGLLVSILYFIFLVKKYTDFRFNNAIYILYILILFFINNFIDSIILKLLFSSMIIITYFKLILNLKFKSLLLKMKI